MPYFSAVNFEHEFIYTKSELGKDDGKPGNDHESKKLIVGICEMC